MTDARCTCGQRSASTLHEAWHPCPVHAMADAPLDLAAIRARVEQDALPKLLDAIMQGMRQAYALGKERPNDIPLFQVQELALKAALAPVFADRAALLAALDAQEEEIARATNALISERQRVASLQAALARLDAVTVEEVAREIWDVYVSHVWSKSKRHGTNWAVDAAAAVVALYAARVAGP